MRAGSRDRPGKATPRRARRASSASFARINQLRAHEYVAEQIRRHIALRLVPAGESLPAERELAAMFGVGRPTVQLALRLLEAERLVDTRRGRHGGTFVVNATDDVLVMDELIARVRRERDELTEVLVYRRSIEPSVARVAAAQRRKTDLAAVRAATERMTTVTSEEEYMRADTELHLAVAGATRNRFLARAIEEIRVRLNDAIVLLPESDLWHERINQEHEAIVQAIELGDEGGAEEAMEIHVANAERGLRAVLAAVQRRSTPPFPPARRSLSRPEPQVVAG
ncbi:MAG: FCD domain-containing protein [Actinomycetota bacterium]|nr:FCD domain-containing protein [Actinomycetota bacterium]